MKAKYYFVFYVVFVVVFCGGFYAISEGGSDITLALWGKTITLHPIIWLTLGISIFFLFTLLFFVGNWFSKFTHSYRSDRDYDHIITQIYAQILQRPIPTHTFKTQHYQTLSNILARVNLKANLSSEESQNPKIDMLFKELEEIAKGGVSKIEVAKDSIFWERNIINKLRADLKFVLKILEGDYPANIKEKAIEELVDNNLVDEKLIGKFISSQPNPELTKHFLQALLQKGYKLGTNEFFELLNLLHATPKEFFHYAQKLKTQLEPDACIDLFHRLALQKSEAREAYVFILLDYSMTERAQDFLNDYEDLTLPKAFVELKKMGKNYPLEKFFE